MAATITAPDSTTPMVELDLITSKGNLRREVGDVEELAASIEAVGLIEPLVVTRNGGKGYDLLAGHRRLEALKTLKWKTAPVHIIDTSASDADVARLAIQLVENLQRHDLDPLEEAQGYAQLTAFGWKQSDVAKRVGRSEAHVSKRLALLKLPDKAIDMYQAGQFGSESLYELTKVVEVEGADIGQVLDGLNVDHKASEPIRHQAVESRVASAVRDAANEKERAERVAELDAQGIRTLKAKVDQYGRATPPKDQLDGWSGPLADIDPEKHFKEPCHAVCVYLHYGSVYESHHCTDRRRHEPDGASKLKAGKKSSASASEKAKEAAHRELTKNMLEAAGAVMEGRAPSRDKVIDRMATLYIRSLGADARKRAIQLLELTAEVEAEEASTYWAFEKFYDQADTASRFRLLLAAILADGHTRSSGFHLYDDARADHLDFLADLGQSFERPTIHPERAG